MPTYALGFLLLCWCSTWTSSTQSGRMTDSSPVIELFVYASGAHMESGVPGKKWNDSSALPKARSLACELEWPQLFFMSGAH